MRPLLVLQREEAFVVHNTTLWAGGEIGNGRRSASTLIFDIDVERRPNRPVVARVVGPVDLLTSPALRVCVDDNVTDDNGLVLDLSGVDFLTASGLTVLAYTEDRAGREHLAWALVANTRPVIRPLDLLGLRERLPTYVSLPLAVAAVCSTTGRPDQG